MSLLANKREWKHGLSRSGNKRTDNRRNTGQPVGAQGHWLRPGARHPWDRLGLCWDEGPALDPNEIEAQVRQARRILQALTDLTDIH